MPPLSFASWTRSLSARGYRVLPSSHAVPVSLWLDAGDRVLHFGARATRLWLAAHDPHDLTSLLLRAECDCAEHRTAGAAGRTVLAPGARPHAVVELDGAAVFGWTGIEATLLPLAETAGVLESLLARLPLPTTAVEVDGDDVVGARAS